VEFALKLGDQHKMVGGDTKRILRRAMQDILPPKILDRRDKIGFATPEQTWFQGPLRRELGLAIENTLTLFPELFRTKETLEFTNQMLDSRRPFDFSLWRIVNFGIWGRLLKMSL
jgi:asparagine synthase (glutamine-hydrolysing)